MDSGDHHTSFEEMFISTDPFRDLPGLLHYYDCCGGFGVHDYDCYGGLQSWSNHLGSVGHDEGIQWSCPQDSLINPYQGHPFRERQGNVTQDLVAPPHLDNHTSPHSQPGFVNHEAIQPAKSRVSSMHMDAMQKLEETIYAVPPSPRTKEKLMEQLMNMQQVLEAQSSGGFILAPLSSRPVKEPAPSNMTSSVEYYTSDTASAAQVPTSGSYFNVSAETSHSTPCDATVSFSQKLKPSKDFSQCTYPACGLNVKRKTDWKRHEETQHWPQKQYICLDCLPTFKTFDGSEVCTFCLSPVQFVQSKRHHYLTCGTAQDQATIFRRKDKFQEHLKRHGPLNLTYKAREWTFEVESGWPKQCGFCGVQFDCWNERFNHIQEEFNKGYRMNMWRLPFIPYQSHENTSSLHTPDDNDSDDEINEPKHLRLPSQIPPITSTHSALISSDPFFGHPSCEQYGGQYDIGAFDAPFSIHTKREKTGLDLKQPSTSGCREDRKIGKITKDLKGIDLHTGKQHVGVSFLPLGLKGEIDDVPISSKVIAQKSIRKHVMNSSEQIGLRNDHEYEKLLINWKATIHIVGMINTDIYSDDNRILTSPLLYPDLQSFMVNFSAGSRRWPSLQHTSLSKWICCLSSAINFLHLQDMAHGSLSSSYVYIRGPTVLLSHHESIFNSTTLPGSDPSSSATYSRLLDTQAKDILSLGKIFAEMHTLLAEIPLTYLWGFSNDFKEFPNDYSSIISLWLEALSSTSVPKSDVRIVQQMIIADPKARPTSRALKAHFSINGVPYQLDNNSRSDPLPNPPSFIALDSTSKTTRGHPLEPVKRSFMLDLWLAEPPRENAVMFYFCNESPHDVDLQTHHTKRNCYSVDAWKNETIQSTSYSDSATVLSKALASSISSAASITTAYTNLTVSEAKVNVSPLTEEQTSGVPLVSSGLEELLSDHREEKLRIPCEFRFIDCQVTFDLNDMEAWIDHSLSHFARCGPPKKSGCIFCDWTLETVSTDPKEILAHWRERMLHIAQHYETNTRRTSNPDHQLLLYMEESQLITSKDYAHAIRYPHISDPEDDEAKVS